MRTIDEEKSAGAGWRRERGTPSLSEVHGSIPVAEGAPNWRKAAAFLGPGYLVAVGYMDPGNWATSIAGGSRFGYALLFVVLLSSLMAMILQALAARLAIATRRFTPAPDQATRAATSGLSRSPPATTSGIPAASAASTPPHPPLVTTTSTRGSRAP